MKIEAAARLKAAYADVEKARAYLESVAKITVNEPAGRMQGLQVFAIDSSDVMDARKNLTAKFGTSSPGESTNVPYEWDLGQDRFIQISYIRGKYYISVKDNKAR